MLSHKLLVKDFVRRIRNGKGCACRFASETIHINETDFQLSRAGSEEPTQSNLLKFEPKEKPQHEGETDADPNGGLRIFRGAPFCPGSNQSPSWPALDGEYEVTDFIYFV